MSRRLTLWIFVFFIASASVFGAVVATPPSPTQTDTVVIRVQNSFGAEAHVASATIMRIGNTFSIQQNVEIACTLPSNPLVVSQFAVGPLAPGVYNVNATITFTGIGPPPVCTPAPITQTTSFTVVPNPAIPALDARALLLLAVILAGSAVVVLRTRG